MLVRNGLDLARFPPRPHAVAMKAPTILGVGSLLHVKRWDRLLKTAAELKRRGFDFRVEIAGTGPMRSSLESAARDLDVAERVTFLGHVSDVEDRLRRAAFLVHTSDSEGCPNAVIEAMAAGLPIVATDSGDVPRLVEHGKTGFVVSREDHDSLVEYVAALLADDELCRAMGNAGRLKAEQEFCLARLVSQTLDVYRAAGWRDQACRTVNAMRTDPSCAG